MHLRSLCAVLAALVLAAAPAAAASDPPSANAAPAAAAPTANGLLDQLDAGDFAGAEARFDAQMAAAVPAAKLKELWASLPAQVGASKGRGEARVSNVNGLQMVAIPLHYEKAELLAQVAINDKGQISGFLVKPAPAPQAAAPAADAPFSEQPFQVGTAETGLPGTLALPKGQPPGSGWPAVVLVHGSGPHDRDETIGPNRPFLDIARGLAAQGIAVLRYDKRTMARPQDFSAGEYTVDDETTNDAVLAVAALRGTPGIDASRIYVLGHSQGAMLAPRIARKVAQSGAPVAGLVMLAAPARSLLDILPEQNRYLLQADGDMLPAEQAFLDDLDAKIARVRSGQAMPDKDTPLGLPAAYWRDFDTIDPVADALAVDVPLLLLQGGRDFQVVDTDWQLWQRALAGHANATLKHYAPLNHLGITGSGRGSMAEYQQAGHVDAGLIADIASWINQRSTRN
ncbi:alpha/beta fold hydrolase [Lysobacter ciconiae]|uniref:Alpha/beta fold hydrolase n=1 Tax=Novilysobacter ciconiae TaxID=2781022 RepID=A0A7S6UEW8_9GAMM|nr:alpha/beta fold hydrolase [Lysobacter ciconiae]QOW19013.1 alpha/beta fold hydrolase [Lysobacter ciconiae]